ncbi:hypothetical protein LX16_0717 [Stackebrandtia albiflava]|uniref:DUF4878 domain-containing protein n=1 Tax=Stackebrandtia albiflava TaxID=406432 RepID=A0A562VAW0_9ACTN|nr:hypothetical protein [Stackebrandtia albiflava]TWJ15020.1 hypothetical protein LX16_0717 [Stackebrandtia albiflava]
MSRIRRAAAVATAAAITLSACGTNPEEDALTQAVSEYVVAYTSGDVLSAYAMLSDRCKEQISVETFEVLVKGAADQYGTREVLEITVDSIRSDRGKVTYDVGVTALSKSEQNWLRVGDTWRWDAC